MRLPAAPDPLILSLLLRAKYFLAHATAHSLGHSELDRMVAIHGLDNTVEFVLKIVAQHLDLESKTGKNLDYLELSGLAGEINKYLLETTASALPYLSDLKMLRQIRNLVQHGAVDPATDLPRLRTVVERFFDRIVLQVFGLERENLFVSAILRDSLVANPVHAAEEALNAARYLECVIACRNAFENALLLRTIRSGLTRASLPALLEAQGASERSLWFFKRLSEEVELSKLGVHMGRYRRFEEYTEYLPRDDAAEGGGFRVMPRTWQEQDARFCFGFVSETVLRWQDEDMPRLYEYSPSSEEHHEFLVNGIVAGRSGDETVTYIFNEGGWMHLYHTDGDARRQLRDLAAGDNVTFATRTHVGTNVPPAGGKTVTLKGIWWEHIAHSPECWRLLLWEEP